MPGCLAGEAAVQTAVEVEGGGADSVLGSIESPWPWGIWGLVSVQWKFHSGESRGGMRHHLSLNDHSICSRRQCWGKQTEVVWPADLKAMAVDMDEREGQHEQEVMMEMLRTEGRELEGLTRWLGKTGHCRIRTQAFSVGLFRTLELV